MKKVIMWIIIMIMLLSGCTAEEAAAPDGAAKLGSTSPLMQGREVASEEGNAWYLNCDAITDIPYARLCEWGNELLIWGEVYDADTGGYVYCIRTIDLESGQQTKELKVPYTGFTTVQFMKDYICFNDSSTGQISVYNRQLTLEKELSYTPDRHSWYVGTDFQTLYSTFHLDGNVWKIDLENQTEMQLFPDARSVAVCAVYEDSMLVSCLNNDGDEIYELDLATGEMKKIEVDGYFGSVEHVENTWLLQSGAQSEWVIMQEDTLQKIIDDDSLFMLLNSGHIYRWDVMRTESYRVYESNGDHVSSLTPLEGGSLYLTGDLVWVEAYNGYFTVQTDGAASRLVFWDISCAQEGDPLTLVPYKAEEEFSEAGQKAEALSEQYDVEICILDECSYEYGEYCANMILREDTLQSAMDQLEAILVMYPEDYFSQLQYGDFEELRIELVGNFYEAEDMYHLGLDAPVVCYEQRDNAHVLAVNVNEWFEFTLHGKIAEIMEGFLAYDAAQRPEALFNRVEFEWMHRQREGYVFPYGDVNNLPDYAIQACEEGYFANYRACLSPLDDRISVWQYAMTADNQNGMDQRIFSEKPELLNKLGLYDMYIRDAFDTTGWPEVTRWEEPIYG